jgi:hypothetical protein
MSADELRQLLRASVFRPFSVFVNDQAFSIPHPESAALAPHGRTLIVFHQQDTAFDILDVPLIARVLVQESKAGGT